MKVSAVIITFNEEKNIRAAIDSVAWADEVVVVDSESTDRTREIANELGAKVIVNKWPGFSKQKEFAMNKAANDWILSLDADERVTPELAKEIQQLTKTDPEFFGYRIPRLSIYMCREIKHSGWYPDRQLRFFDKRKAAWNDRLVHESIKIAEGAAVGDLNNDILHFSVENAAHHHKMIGERYAPLAAEQMFISGRRSGPLKTAVAGPAAFIRSYILKLGFLDGFPGLCIASFAAYHAFLKYLLLWEMQQQPEENN